MNQPPRSLQRSSTLSASLTMSSGETSFAAANGWFERFLADARMPEEAHGDLLVVFEEVVTNIVTHAYRGAAGTIDITAERTADALTLTLRDDGPAFDPIAYPEPRCDLPVAERPVGGLGVHLVKNLCDRIEYRRRGESNILVMTKQLG